MVGDANFNVVVNVSRKTKPISLNVKASAHALQAQLLCENSQGDKVELSSSGLNAINLGEVRFELNKQKNSVIFKLRYCDCVFTKQKSSCFLSF